MTSSDVLIAFQGTKGAHSDVAAKEFFKSAEHFKSISIFETIGFDASSEVCASVKQGKAQYAILPFENSSTGTMLSNYDLMNEFGLFIVGEYCTKETQCLIALPGVPMEQITEICSHPYAIDQCKQFLSKLDKAMTISQGLDTAGSAQNIKLKNLKTSAAIASKEAASLYGLAILQEGIEDECHSITRYLVLSKEIQVPERHLEPKTSLSFTMKNTTGAFFKALACFSLREINISKVESRPSSRSINLATPWEYVMYLDIDGSSQDDKIKAALLNLQEFALVRLLGSYPRHRSPVEPLMGMYGIHM